MQTTHTTRRAVLAGTAAMPALALAIPAAAETDDPAVAAVQRFVAADAARNAYTTPDGVDYDKDPTARALAAEADRLFAAIGETPPTSAAGLALGFAAVLFDWHGTARECRFAAAETWFSRAAGERSGTEDLMVALFRSPAAVELLHRLGAAPVSAGASAAAPVAEDPAVAAYRVWRDAMRAWDAEIYASDGPDDAESERLHVAEHEARAALADAVATTPAGIACKVRFAFDTFGNIAVRGEAGNPDDYTFGNWGDDLEERLLRSTLAAAERLAGRVAT